MERFPESWVMQHLQGPLVFQGVDFISCDYTMTTRTPHAASQETTTTQPHPVYRCWLCGIKGDIRSEKSCLEHCRGRRHQRQYSFLVRQQRAWLEEQLVPTSFGVARESYSHHDHCHHRRRYTSSTADKCDGPTTTSTISNDEEEVLGYFMPFRRWHFGQWEVGLSCQLCGTAAFPNRWAILEHCESSRRHVVLRNRTLFCGNYHPEITETTNLLKRIQQLPSRYYRWYMERELLHYVSAKEASMAEVMSRRYAWYQVWKKLETFELRYRMSILECAIWKEHMLQYDSNIRFTGLSELETFLQDHGLDYESYRTERRKSSQAFGIIICVIPFLQDVPKITKASKP